MRNQGLERDAPCSYEIKEGGHVPSLRPAHVADRVVQSALLVLGVIAARPVGARKAQLQFLCIERSPRHLHPDVADHDHATAVPAQLRRKLDRVARLRCGGDDDRIAIRDSGRQAVAGKLMADEAFVDRARRARQSHQVLREVEPIGLCACGLDELSGKLTDEPETDDRDPLAEPDLGLTHSLHGDAAERAEGALLERHRLWKADTQVERDVVDLCVNRVVSASAGHPVAGRDASHARAHRDRDSGGRIPEARGLDQFRSHDGGCLANAVAPRFVDHLVHLVGA